MISTTRSCRTGVRRFRCCARKCWARREVCCEPSRLAYARTNGPTVRPDAFGLQRTVGSFSSDFKLLLISPQPFACRNMPIIFAAPTQSFPGDRSDDVMFRVIVTLSVIIGRLKLWVLCDDRDHGRRQLSKPAKVREALLKNALRRSMLITNRLLLVAAVSTMTATPAFASTFSVDRAPGRLRKNVVPVSYAITIVPHIAARTLEGRETVVLQVRSTTDIVQFNSLNEVLRDVRLDGKRVKRVVTNNEAQLPTITLASPAAIGAHTLSFSYSGKIENQPRGLFAQAYSA